jgi:hypothetical protein
MSAIVKTSDESRARERIAGMVIAKMRGMRLLLYVARNTAALAIRGKRRIVLSGQR